MLRGDSQCEMLEEYRKSSKIHVKNVRKGSRWVLFYFRLCMCTYVCMYVRMYVFVFVCLFVCKLKLLHLFTLVIRRGGLYRELSVLTEGCREANSDNHEWTRTKAMLGKVRFPFMPRYEPRQMIQNRQDGGRDVLWGFVLTIGDGGVMINDCGCTTANISWCKRMWRD